MSGIVDELTLGTPVLFALRNVGYDDGRRLRANRRDPGELERALIRAGDLDLDRALAEVEEARREGPEGKPNQGSGSGMPS